MPEYKSIFKRVRKYILFLLALYVLVGVLRPIKAIFLGLILGTSLSLFNLWVLVRKMKQFGEVMVNGGKIHSLGLLTRMATAVFAVLVAMEYSELYPSYFCGYWINDSLYCHYDRYFFNFFI